MQEKKREPNHIFPAKRPFSGRWAVIAWAALVVLALSVCFELSVRTLAAEMAVAQGESLAAEAVNYAVGQSGSLHQYNELVSLEKDDIGNITMVKINGYVLNELTGEIVETCEDRLMNSGEVPLSVPFGSVMNSQILSTTGPVLPVCLSLCRGQRFGGQRICLRRHQPDQTPHHRHHPYLSALHPARAKRGGAL
ncbi:MAG: hypothetical protein ACLUO4_02810 [Christensenellales bacterium]